MEWQNRLKLVELSNNPKDEKTGQISINIHLELILRSNLGIERWPIEYKEKLGWRLVCCAIRRKPSSEEKNRNFVSIDPRHSRQPYFPHIFILCLHYGTNSGPLSCTLRLKQNSSNPLYRLNDGKPVQV